MTKKGLILLLLALSWPITCISKLWAGNYCEVHYFLPSRTWDYLNWYAYHICNTISYIFIFVGMWLYINSHLKRDKDIIYLFGANVINQVIDLPHYLLFRRESAVVLFAQGAIIIYASFRILLTQIRKK